MTRVRLFSPLLVLSCCVQASQDHAKALVDWIRSKPNGFVSEKMEIRHMVPGDEKSPMGVYASQDIAANETVLVIPRDFYLGLEEDEIEDTSLYDRETVTMDEVMDVHLGNACLLTRKLLEELEKYDQNPEASDYAPYLAYLKNQRPGQLPATYSPAAKTVLRVLSGPLSDKSAKSANYGKYSLPPWQLVDWIDSHFVEIGCINQGDELAYHAAAMAIQRGYDSELIPVWDMFNHHNELLNLDTNSLRSKEGLKVWASEPIKAGTELYATYNYCEDCYNVGDEWGTPGIYRDFGFVEDYPQMWPFLDHNIEYEVEKDKETGVLYAVFDDRDPKTGMVQFGLPDQKGLAYLRTEFARVEKFDIDEELSKLGQAKLSQHEYESITRYHQAVLSALKAGIEATLIEYQKHNLTGSKEEL